MNETVPDETLSKIEEDILQKLADGATLESVADERGVSCTTIYYHLNRIRARFGSPNAMHAVVTAVRRGLID